VLRLIAVALVTLGCGAAPPRQTATEQPHVLSRAAKDAAWDTELARIEGALAGGRLTPDNRRQLSDTLRARRDAAFQKKAPPMTPAMVRRTASLIRELETMPNAVGGPVTPFVLIFEWPIEGAPVTSEFGERPDPFDRRVIAFHTGIDLAAETGRAIQAAAPGSVAYEARRGDVCGLTVAIDHPYGYRTEYCHLAEAIVAPGDAVRGGQVVGLVGASGRATGTHLHWIVRHLGSPVDPRTVLGAKR
jgi:murein DD-endopeptidase MepM/ murein hydrolase activator NlpD